MNQLCLTAARQDNYRVIDLILEVYDRMQANDRPCWLRVAISSPISRSQADLLNEQRNSAGALFGSAVSTPIGTITPIGGFVVGGLVGSYVTSRIPTFHSGDRIVSIQAQVQGGIGPQRTIKSLIINSRAA
ncbi:hypothetical protein [uncultured Pseudomonas sp.]|uniref:hypothetical protein n=1 Tax=uncultured Pseudomonas sp. TaxID=114707 RepID=UPI002583789C|nr:hypothetical protein [uncultured Pseudomonas sp.]